MAVPGRWRWPLRSEDRGSWYRGVGFVDRALGKKSASDDRAEIMEAMLWDRVVEWGGKPTR